MKEKLELRNGYKDKAKHNQLLGKIEFRDDCLSKIYQQVKHLSND